jgi:menaquinone-dependent protoporphyrinogen oxidase
MSATMSINVLVTYSTRHNGTADIANCIGTVLRAENHKVTIAPVDFVGDVTPYQAVVLGSAVYAGAWQKEAAHFLTANADALAKRPVWFFSSGPTGEGDAASIMHGWRFPEALQPIADRIQPHDIAFFHGRIDLDKLHFAEKLIIKAMNVKTGDFRDWEVIRAWAGKIALELRQITAAQTEDADPR